MGLGGYEEDKCAECGNLVSQRWYCDGNLRCWDCKTKFFNRLDNKVRERDVHFIELAKLIASRSKDPSTQTGAVIVDKLGRIISTGYNGFPRKMKDDLAQYADRTQKYSRIVHCEMNALIFARTDLTGCTLYTWPFLSCDRCVVHMIQSGIDRFVAPRCPASHVERWEPILEVTRSYIKECVCTFTEYDV